MSGRQLCKVHLCTVHRRVAAAWPRRSSAGFTLIELLVAITLFALLTAILASGLRFGARVWEQADTVAEQVTGVESAYAIVRRLIATALPLSTTTLSGEATIQFQGSSDAVSFVGPAPVQAFVGGLHAITLARVRGRSGDQLVLQVRDFAPVVATARPRQAAAGSGAAKTVVLIDGASSIDFVYFGPGENSPVRSWQPTWLTRTLLPELVSVRVSFPRGDRRVWPDLIIAPTVREGTY